MLLRYRVRHTRTGQSRHSQTTAPIGRLGRDGRRARVRGPRRRARRRWSGTRHHRLRVPIRGRGRSPAEQDPKLELSASTFREPERVEHLRRTPAGRFRADRGSASSRGAHAGEGALPARKQRRVSCRSDAGVDQDRRNPHRRGGHASHGSGCREQRNGHVRSVSSSSPATSSSSIRRPASRIAWASLGSQPASTGDPLNGAACECRATARR